MTAQGAAPWLVWPVLAPLAGALVAFLVPRLAVGAGLLAGAAVVVCSAGLILGVATGGVVRYPIGGWGAPLGIDLVADGLSAWMVGVTALVGAAVSLHALGHFGGREQAHARRYFWPLWLFLWAGLNALFLSADVFNLYVTLELTSFAAVALAALAGTKDALTAATRYLLASLLGSLFFLLGVAFLYGEHATVDMELLSRALRPDAAGRVAPALMTAGLLMKGAVFPVHFWLPPAHASAPAPVSAALSALVVKGPFYILARLWMTSFAAVRTEEAGALLGALGAGALVWGGVLALRQARLKLIVAYSTVAQLGYLYLMFPLVAGAGAPAAHGGGVFFAGAHACAKGAMFLAAGNVAHALGHDEIARMGGLARALPRSAAALALSGIALMGMPPSGGFVFKWLLLSAAFAEGRWIWVAAVAAGTALSIGYVVRLVDRTLAEPPEPLAVRPVPAIMEWTALALSLLAVVMGLLAAGPLSLISAGAPVSGPLLREGAP